MGSEDAIDVERFHDRTGIEIDDAYRLLADGRVRTTLRVLGEREVVGIERLTEAVLGAEDRGRRAEVVRLELVHVTLPTLEAHGLVTRDHGDDRIAVERGLEGERFVEAVAGADP